MRRQSISIALAACAALGLLATRAAAALPGEDPLGGRVTAQVDGRTLLLPVLKTDIDANVQGDLATVTVTQTFANPATVPLNAKYLFPLNKDAAVHAMSMRVGDEIVRAQIQKREEARATFEAGKRAGKAAALLEQHRPNMFTQEIANLMPGLPVTVTLTYSQVVPRIDGAYEIVVPLVVGPRYVPAPRPATRQVVDLGAPDSPPAEAETTPAPSGAGVWQLGPVPDYPAVAGLTIPDEIDKERVAIRVAIASDMPITSVASRTHGIDVSGSETRRTAALASRRTIDNKDFVLRYDLAGDAAQAGVLTHRDGAGGTFSMLIEPPQVPQAADIAPRELVFILDTSGSMAGKPIAASKAFMRHALENLRPTDHFRVIRFSEAASQFASSPVPATQANIAAGIAYVESLTAEGGTEMMRGLQLAYGAAQTPDTLRLVVFLSDGYVGNEAEILRMVADRVRRGRLYAFGIGRSVNRYLMAEMARLGRGIARFVDPTETGHEAAIAFARRLESPVLTDIAIDWGTLRPSEVTPTHLPDLFAGHSIRVQGRFNKAAFDKGRHTVKVSGRVNGRAATLPVTIDLSAEASLRGGEAITQVWARSRIADAMRDLMVPLRLRPSQTSDDDLENKITALGLAHSLVTQWTSFVAVSESVVNAAPAEAADADVPLHMVDGVAPSAYPKAGTQQSHPPAGTKPTRKLIEATAPKIGLPSMGPILTAFNGASAPEPEHFLGFCLLGLIGWWRWLTLRRRTNAA